MKILSLFILLFNLSAFSQSAYADFFSELLEEAKDATRVDRASFGTNFETKDQVISGILVKFLSPEHSSIFESFKEKAVSYIKEYTDFKRKGISISPPWTQIAYLALGTANTEQRLSCLVALADFRGLPKFKAFLNQLVKDVDLSVEEGTMEILSKRFSDLRV